MNHQTSPSREGNLTSKRDLTSGGAEDNQAQAWGSKLPHYASAAGLVCFLFGFIFLNPGVCLYRKVTFAAWSEPFASTSMWFPAHLGEAGGISASDIPPPCSSGAETITPQLCFCRVAMREPPKLQHSTGSPACHLTPSRTGRRQHTSTFSTFLEHFFGRQITKLLNSHSTHELG